MRWHKVRLDSLEPTVTFECAQPASEKSGNSAAVEERPALDAQALGSSWLLVSAVWLYTASMTGQS